MADELDFTISEAAVVPVPVDDTLSIAGQAADAKAVGDALADKADRSELAAAITVNDQAADAQGSILVTAEHVPMDDNETETVAQAMAALAARTGEDIPINGDVGAVSIEAALEAVVGSVIDELGGDPIPLEHGGTGAATAAAAKAALGLGMATQDVEFSSPSGVANQLFAILSNIVNASSPARGDRIGLYVNANGLLCWNQTGGEAVWSLGVPVTMAQGGTGAADAAGAKVNLGLQSAGQGVNILQPEGNGQALALLANVNNANSSLDGHRVNLLVEDSAIRLFDVTAGANVWQLPVPVGVAQGGTGAATAPAALANLGIATKTLSGMTSENGNIAAGLDPSRYVVLAAYSAGRICAPYMAVSGSTRSTYIHLNAFNGTPVANTEVAVAVVYMDLGTNGVPV